MDIDPIVFLGNVTGVLVRGLGVQRAREVLRTFLEDDANWEILRLMMEDEGRIVEIFEPLIDKAHVNVFVDQLEKQRQKS